MSQPLSHLTGLLTRPSTLPIIAVLGSGAFYIGLKSKTEMAKQARREVGKGGEETNYEVSTSRSGGGI